MLDTRSVSPDQTMPSSIQQVQIRHRNVNSNVDKYHSSYNSMNPNLFSLTALVNANQHRRYSPDSDMFNLALMEQENFTRIIKMKTTSSFMVGIP